MLKRDIQKEHTGNIFFIEADYTGLIVKFPTPAKKVFLHKTMALEYHSI